MGTSAVPALIDALVSTARTALPNVLVYDGFGVSDEPGDFLMVGVDDPDAPDQAVSADTQQDWANANYTARDETGTVTCAALSWNGDGDQKAARDACYAITAALEAALRTTPSLGVASVLWTSYGTTARLTQAQDGSGALALLVFSVAFRARI
jgi:hypothetical protein